MKKSVLLFKLGGLDYSKSVKWKLGRDIILTSDS